MSCVLNLALLRLPGELSVYPGMFEQLAELVAGAGGDLVFLLKL